MLEEEFDHLTFKPSYSKKGNSLKLEKIEAEEQAQDTVHRKLMHLTLEDDLDVWKCLLQFPTLDIQSAFINTERAC